MPRGNRHYVPGMTWHLTHRCHNREFLLKFRHDRERYRYWLEEARKRYGFCVINYNLTSNHIHLIVHDEGIDRCIERSMQLIEGRVGQEYNQRKNRVGAFWQDRYHATAVQSGLHLRRCLTYVDMNMVRAGVVPHPEKWPTCGYQEIQGRISDRPIVNLEQACLLTGFSTVRELAAWQRESIRVALLKELQRDALWTESLAVGDVSYIRDFGRQLGFRARFREVVKSDDYCTLEEVAAPYITNLQLKKGEIGL